MSRLKRSRPRWELHQANTWGGLTSPGSGPRTSEHRRSRGPRSEPASEPTPRAVEDEESRQTRACKSMPVARFHVGLGTRVYLLQCHHLPPETHMERGFDMERRVFCCRVWLKTGGSNRFGVGFWVCAFSVNLMAANSEVEIYDLYLNSPVLRWEKKASFEAC